MRNQPEVGAVCRRWFVLATDVSLELVAYGGYDVDRASHELIRGEVGGLDYT